MIAGLGSLIWVKNQDFAGTGYKINSNLAVTLTFGLCHILVARADNHINRSHLTGSIGKCSNTVRTAHDVDLVCTGISIAARVSGLIQSFPFAAGAQAATRLTPAVFAGIINIRADEKEGNRRPEHSSSRNLPE